MFKLSHYQCSPKTNFAVCWVASHPLENSPHAEKDYKREIVFNILVCREVLLSTVSLLIHHSDESSQYKLYTDGKAQSFCSNRQCDPLEPFTWNGLSSIFGNFTRRPFFHSPVISFFFRILLSRLCGASISIPSPASVSSQKVLFQEKTAR